MRSVSLLKTVLFLSVYTILDFKVEAACSQLGEVCNEDCECCDTETNPGIKCESRGADDRKCYLSSKIGASCTVHSECKSQWCSGNICVPKFTHGPRDPHQKSKSYCKLDLAVEQVIDGIVPNGNGSCACNNPSSPTKENAQTLISSPGTAYSNNYALGSGFILRPRTSGPVRFVDICTGDGDYNRDPTSYKIQRKCAETGILKTIQEGALSFPMREKNGPEMTKRECTRVTISGKKSFYLQYIITFPTQRFGDPSCSPTAPCKNYPTSISELSLYGHCSQVADAPETLAPTPKPTPSPTARTHANVRVSVKCINSPCDKDGAWDQSDVYVKVIAMYWDASKWKTMFITCGTTWVLKDANEDKRTCWSRKYIYCNNLPEYRHGGWYVRLEIYDQDGGADYRMGDIRVKSSSLPKTISTTSRLSSTDSRCAKSSLDYEVRFY